MSDSDSFINEVSEEVRRDELFGYIRKYGWIAVTLVLALVGGAAYNEYSKAKTESAAQAVGDAMLTAMGEDDPAARAQALAAVEAQGPSAAVTALLTAATQQEAGQLTEAAATLNTLAQNAEVPEIYCDLAAIKAAGLRAGIAMNPDTDPRRLLPYLDSVDLALCMTVFPGFGGQAFIPTVLDSIRFLAAERTRRGGDFRLEVDGGVNAETGLLCRAAGEIGRAHV